MTGADPASASSSDAHLRGRREAIVREHMASENRHDFDATIETFARPRYEIVPSGDVYDWYTRGVELLRARNPAAAAALLEHAARAEPGSRSVREALARAQFDSGQFQLARDNFAAIVAEKAPSGPGRTSATFWTAGSTRIVTFPVTTVRPFTTYCASCAIASVAGSRISSVGATAKDVN